MTRRLSIRKRKKDSVITMAGRSLFIFSETNPIRKFLRSVVENEYFDNFVLHLIGLNSILLTLDEPVLTDPYTI